MRQILFVFFISIINCFAQLIDPSPINVQLQTSAVQQFNKLTGEIKSFNNYKLNHNEEPVLINISNQEIIVDGLITKIVCDITVNSRYKRTILRNQEVVYKNDKMISCPSIIKSFKDKVNESKLENFAKNKKQNVVTTDQYINIIESDNVFARFPLAKDKNQNIVYEMDAEYTLNAEDVQLFSRGSEVDGCLYYPLYGSEAYNRSVVFYVDPDWGRILYTKYSGSESVVKFNKAFYYDTNVDLDRPIAIDVNENGEVFVLDQGQKCVFKFTYTAAGNVYLSPEVLIRRLRR